MKKPFLKPLLLGCIIALFCSLSAVAELSTTMIGGTPVYGMDKTNIVANRYFVVFKKNRDVLNNSVSMNAYVKHMEKMTAGEVKHIFDFGFQGFSIETDQAGLAILAKDPHVAYIETVGISSIGDIRDDFLVKTPQTQKDPINWGLDRIDQRDLPLSKSFSYADDGTGVHIYVLDTGINPRHVEFTGRVHIDLDVFTGNNNNNGIDCQGHGTHVAGIAAGTQYGVAKKAQIHVVRVLDCAGSGPNDGVAQGIQWVVKNAQRPAIINMSLGDPNYSQVMNDATNAAVDAGIFVTVAAGNGGYEGCDSPASAEKAVAAGNSTASDKRSSDSQYGRCIDMWAPGEYIISADFNSVDGNTSKSGTSLSAPHIAGAAALLWQSHPNDNVNQLIDRMTSMSSKNKLTGIGSNSPNRLLYTGPGEIDPNAPVAKATVQPSQIHGAGTVSVSGSGSTDPNGLPLRYNWSVLEGENVVIDNAIAESTTVRIDERLGGQKVELRLIVTNSNNKVSSAQVSVVQTSDTVIPPDAKARVRKNKIYGAGRVKASAGASSDTNYPELSITYSWRIAQGEASLSTASGQDVEVIFSDRQTEQSVLVEVTVTNSKGKSSTATARIKHRPESQLPANGIIAMASVDSEVVVGKGSVIASAEGSEDRERQTDFFLRYKWKVLQGTAVINSPESKTVSVDFADTSTTNNVVLEVTVYDGFVFENPRTSKETVDVLHRSSDPTQTAPPVAKAAVSQSEVIGAGTIQASAEGSYDQNSPPLGLSYQWKVVQGIASVVSPSAKITDVTFADTQTTQTVLLEITVTNSKGKTDTARVSVTHSPTGGGTALPPEASARLSDSFVFGRATVQASATGSRDTNNPPLSLSYYWEVTKGTAQIANPNAEVVDVVIPNPPATQTVEVQVTVTNAKGKTDTARDSLESYPGF